MKLVNISILCTLTFVVFGIWGCQPEGTPGERFPSGDRLAITWELFNDAAEGDDKYTVQFILTNDSDTTLPKQGWEMYYSQFPHSNYLSAEASMIFSIDHLGGDLYRITPGDSFPSLDLGESITLQYQMPVTKIKNTFAPHGLYMKTKNGEIHPLSNYSVVPFPEDFTFSSRGNPKSNFISAQQRYRQQNDLRNISLDQLPPFMPTPTYWEKTGEYFELNSAVQVTYDPGLEEISQDLGDFLGTILLAVDSQRDENASKINLIIDKSWQGDNEGYHLTMTPNGVEIRAGADAGIYYGIQSLKCMIPPGQLAVASESIILPTAVIRDEPRFKYRGLMIDVSRNFVPADQIKKVIDLMGLYKLNRLHLHLTDDEGWRLEIPGLPELTEVGARRGADFDNGSMLPPAYGSGGDPNTEPGSGFFSREAYIDLLKYAKKNQILVVPEINGPGHARAAIKAMEARYQKYMSDGKESEAREYLLHDINDRSKYSSAQVYNDNVMCVCQPYTYTFLEKVLIELVAMHQEADHPLEILHMGGDEVPHGAWTASPECSQFIDDQAKLNKPADLFPYFVKRYQSIAEQYNVTLAGWEEIVMHADPDQPDGKHIPNEELLPYHPIAFVWNSTIGGGSEDLIYRLANLGFPVVMCNSSNLYLDMAYDYDPVEPGLYWAGYVDTKNAFETTPYNLFQSVFSDEEGNPLNGAEMGSRAVALRASARENILGIQGQLWSETVYSTTIQEYMLLPKLLGLAERAWSQPPIWANETNDFERQRILEAAWARFANRVGKLELPRLDHFAGGFSYRIPPPGAVIERGQLKVNVAFPGLQVRYTTDGSEPNPFSNIFTEPLALRGDETIKLRTFTSTNRGSRLVEISPDSR